MSNGISFVIWCDVMPFLLGHLWEVFQKFGCIVSLRLIRDIGKFLLCNKPSAYTDTYFLD